MGRKNQRQERRSDFLKAFALVLAKHGYAGATIAAVAEKAGFAPGLLHHHFQDKREMLDELLTLLIGQFRTALATRQGESEGDLETYVDAALKLDHRSDAVAARCWVSLLAEGLRDPELFERIRRHLDAEVETVKTISKNRLDSKESAALLAFVLGSLVFGAYAPKKTAGFAATSGKSFLKAITER